MNIFSYEIDGKLYINLTNKCSNACVFCVRNKPSYEGYELWLSKEPTVKEVIESIENIEKYKEVVFCGYGEPTYRVDAICELSDYFHKFNLLTRLNTNGHGNQINGENIAKKLKGKIDKMSISLNASNEVDYEKICKCKYKEQGFQILKDFAKDCVNENIDTTLSIVDGQGVDIDKCKSIAESVGAKLYVRELIL